MSHEISQLFKAVRKRTEDICSSLQNEDYSIQPIVDVSPPKWHLAHSTWFFEQFVLIPHDKSYCIYNKDFPYLFNSYYNNLGERVLRPDRGNMTRPSVSEVYEYRNHVTQALIHYLESNDHEEIKELVTLGIHHEQQHQELLAYDIKYILGHQPLFPKYDTNIQLREEDWSREYISFEEGIYSIGHNSEGFAFDNEFGRHKTYLHSFEISNKLITNSEYQEFIGAGGYKDFNLWHAEGWDYIKDKNIKAPLYWHLIDDEWRYYHYQGLEDIPPNLPVMHISFYEAFAFAEWKGMRLPTEQEWEVSSSKLKWGQLWEWTNSAYLPYPGFNKKPGAIGEYNGKFMVNQMVLRGASIASAKNHSRYTYRNFFHAANRLQFNGIRLVK